jgi:mannan endo-1,4-beta-mannosidase
VVELGSNAPSPPFRSTPKLGQEHLVNVMNEGVAAGMKVIRVWAHSITAGWEMQKGPGNYDEKVLKGMDFVMDEAHKRGLKIVWVLADNWYPVGTCPRNACRSLLARADASALFITLLAGGIDSFVKMGGASKHQDFFSNSNVKALYKQHITFIANRVNSINGRKYADDPTIMAWCVLLRCPEGGTIALSDTRCCGRNLANEARCQGCGDAPMQSWISEMCLHTKSVAPKQLVGIGYEGCGRALSPRLPRALLQRLTLCHHRSFYGATASAAQQKLNPADWASKEGQNFVANMQDPCIDYVGMHGAFLSWISRHACALLTVSSAFLQSGLTTGHSRRPSSRSRSSRATCATSPPPSRASL